MPDDRNVYDYLQARNASMVELLDTNMSVSGFIAGLLIHLVEYSKEKGCKFSDIQLEAPFIGDDEYLRARIVIDAK